MIEITEEIITDLMENACGFQGLSLEARNKVREQYKENEKSEENSFRLIIDGLVAKIAQEQTTKTITVTDEKISYQLSLITSFTRTHFLISDLYMQGDLIEALTLIRKQFESLVRLHEIDSKPLQKLHKKTPNVCNVFKPAGKKIYPKLSEVAHFGTAEVGELLKVVEEGDLVGPSLIPAYHKYSLACFDLNSFMAIHFLGWIIEKLAEFHDDFDGEIETGVLMHATKMALDLGIIVIPEE